MSSKAPTCSLSPLGEALSPVLVGCKHSVFVHSFTNVACGLLQVALYYLLFLPNKSFVGHLFTRCGLSNPGNSHFGHVSVNFSTVD